MQALGTWHALLAELYGRSERLKQPDKSSLHLLRLSCFITYHKMNRNNKQQAEIAGNEISPSLIGIGRKHGLRFQIAEAI